MPSTAVTIKLADVFKIDTRVVEDANVSALVNNIHMIALHRRLSAKKMPRIAYDTAVACEVRCRNEVILEESVLVCVVVVLKRRSMLDVSYMEQSDNLNIQLRKDAIECCERARANCPCQPLA